MIKVFSPLYILVIIVISLGCNSNNTSNNITTNNPENSNTSSSDVSAKHQPDSLDKLPQFKIDSIIDKRDSHVYYTLEIGDQVWCITNIGFASKNGNSWDYSNNSNEEVGKLYNWTVAEEACPESFSIPSDDDWKVLLEYVEKELILKSKTSLFNSLKLRFRSKYQNCCHGNSVYSYMSINLSDYSLLNEREKEIIMSIYLDAIGFTTEGTGFRHSYLGHDGYTYFWSSTINRDKHTWKRFKDFTCGSPNPDIISFKNNLALRLKCLKVKV